MFESFNEISTSLYEVSAVFEAYEIKYALFEQNPAVILRSKYVGIEFCLILLSSNVFVSPKFNCISTLN